MAKILIVDDSETLRSQLKKDLETSGHKVLEAFDGVNGLDQIKANTDIQLIICDVNMPEMDGLTMCEHVAKNEAWKKIPIFMLTTESSPEMKERGKQAGVKAWVVKPYVADKILSAVTKVTA